MKIPVFDPWSNSPLGAWAHHHDKTRNLTRGYAARYLERRYRLSPQRASLIAELAKFAGEAD